ncbi:MAG TPA: hypothetical protein VLE43_11095 [Candidatus Saccharimonadia bacterium]|nr:hypothetical protein [Candidatus Saccharimonadia bacterium]
MTKLGEVSGGEPDETGIAGVAFPGIPEFLRPIRARRVEEIRKEVAMSARCKDHG